jgi:hypothetical protein
VRAFAPDGPLVLGVLGVLGIDETSARRRGANIAATGIYRDPVRSSHRHVVKGNGLRWVCVLLLVPIPCLSPAYPLPIPWAGRVWALPFLRALAPAERYAQLQGCRHRHKPLTLWARQLIRLLHRWLPTRSLVVVGDRGYATLDLLAAVHRPRGRSRPDPVQIPSRSRPDPVQILVWFARRWQMAVTCHEVRAHLGLHSAAMLCTFPHLSKSNAARHLPTWQSLSRSQTEQGRLLLRGPMQMGHIAVQNVRPS